MGWITNDLSEIVFEKPLQKCGGFFCTFDNQLINTLYEKIIFTSD